MSYIKKTGYVRMIYRKSRKAEYMHYEDLFFNESLRTRVAKLSEHDCSIYCGCSSDNIAPVTFDELGNILVDTKKGHSEECGRFLSTASACIKKTGLKGYINVRGKISVGFSWSEKARASADIIRLRDLAEPGSTLGLSSWIAFNNCLSFVNRTASARISTDPFEQASSVIFMMGTHGCVNRSSGTEVLFNDEHLFLSKDYSVGGLFYGKISYVPEVGEVAGKKYVYVRTVGLDGRSMRVRVRTAEFYKLLGELPDTENAWMCGFVRKKELKYDKAFGGFDVSKTAVPLPNTKTFVKDEYKLLVNEMSVYRLFSCNRAGMIVFNRNEVAASNDALANGLRLYRPVISSGISGGIMVYNSDSEDACLC